MSNKVTFNGISARRGSYLFDPLSAEELAQVALGNSLDKQPDAKEQLLDLHLRKTREGGESRRDVKWGIDPTKLEQAGWGVIFPAVKRGSEEAKREEAILEALSPLLELRKAQAAKVKEHYYKEYRGANGLRPGESKHKYMNRMGVGVGPADPEDMPYYLLLVGSPEEISFHFQYQLDVQYGVGRIHFDTIEEYANYARSVVAAETGELVHTRSAAFVGVSNPDDAATQLAREYLVGPLADALESKDRLRGWTISRYYDELATKARACELFGGAKTPALLFTTSHGMGFDKGDPLQVRHQGALLMQDWTGPEQWRGPIGEDLYISADDLRSDAALQGMISFNFACYGGGTPKFDEFAKQAFKDRAEIADQAFVASLHRKLLSHPKGGALATIGHVERAWGCSFMGEVGRNKEQKSQITVFESAMQAIMEGAPVGWAFEKFNGRYAELATVLSKHLEDAEFEPESVDPYMIADMWTANNDARGYAILGDPAVRLRFGDEGEAPERETIDASRPLKQPAGDSPAAAPSAAPEVIVKPATLTLRVSGQSDPADKQALRDIFANLEKVLANAERGRLQLEIRSEPTGGDKSASAKLRDGTEVIVAIRNKGLEISIVPASDD